MSDLDDTQQDEREVQKYLHAALCVSSVTHDVNNYLGAIMAYTELIAIEAGDSSEAQRMSAEIVASLEKSSEMLTTLTDIIRLDETRVASIDIALMLEQTVNIFEHEMKRAHISCALDIQGDRSPVRISRARILRIFTHLVRNCVERARGSQAKDISIQFVGESEKFLVYLKDLSGIDPRDQEQEANPLSGYLQTGLRAIQADMHFHKGEVSYDSAKGFVFILPRDTGL